jgi:hypothetical protein
MKKTRLQFIVGLIMVLGQIIVVLTLVYGSQRSPKPYSKEDFEWALAVIMPLFAAHVTIVVKHVARNFKATRSRKVEPVVTGQFSFFVIFFPVLFILYLWSVIAGRVSGLLGPEAGELRTLIGISEALFGAYTGILFDVLFR